jgi:hypothetical protein
MNNKSQSHARTRPVARLEELKPSVSTVAAHKNRADASGHCGRKFPKAFSVCVIPLPVCFRAGFQFGGRINERNGKNTLFHFGTESFENQLKSVLCLVP